MLNLLQKTLIISTFFLVTGLVAGPLYDELQVDSVNIDGSTISTSSGDLTINPAGSLILLNGGTDGQLLTSQTGAAVWQDAPVSTTLSLKGDIQTHDGTDNAALNVGTDGQILSADSVEATGLKWIDLPVSTTLTTKGDLQGFDGTNNVRVPVGTDGQVLTADSSNPNGVSYQDVAGDLQGAYTF